MNFYFNIIYSKYGAWVWYNLKRGTNVKEKWVNSGQISKKK